MTVTESRVGDHGAPDTMDLDEARKRLTEFDERKAQISELSFFGGLSYREMAAVLGILEATIERKLRLGKAWLARELAQSDT